MSSAPIKTQASADGLRYVAKPTGTPFMEGATTGNRMSCFICGKHEQRNLGGWKRILGEKRFCCAEHAPKGHEVS